MVKGPGSRQCHRTRFSILVTAVFVLSCLLSGDHLSSAQSKPTSAWTLFIVPAAQCGPGERAESGLQGQTTFAERFGTKASQSFNCNLELLGQYEGEGAQFDMTTLDNCAYFSTAGAAGQKNIGTVVVDASDRRRPQAVAYLDSPAMLRPNESLEAHSGRKLLAAIQTSVTAPAPSIFDLYETADCRKPVLRGSLSVPAVTGHAGRFAPDGRTYYATSWENSPKPDRDGFVAIDVSDPSGVSVVHRWQAPPDVTPHDIAISHDGTRAYLGLLGGGGRIRAENGLVILDISDIQRRRPNPQVRVLGKLLWDDASGGQVPIPLTIKGRPHVIFTDWTGPKGSNLEAARSACAQGLPPYGFARLIDVSDAQRPTTVSKMLLQVHDPVNCAQVLADAQAASRAGYSPLICTPDNPQNATMVACAWKESGVRVFDVRNPARPVEIGYYKPPGRRTEVRPGSGFTTAGGANRTADWVINVPRFDRERNEIWFMSQDNGLQIVRFTDRFRAARKDLFGSR